MGRSPLATPAATIAVLKRHGLYTKKRLGQHFLVDDNVVARILDLACPSPDDVLLEVGPGIGTLTAALCKVAPVVAVERDKALLPALAETVGSCPVEVVVADAVTVPAERLAEPFGPPTALVANLPYQVAATVVLRVFDEMPSVRSATVMVQAEVADRMTSQEGNKTYGAYTVKLRLRAEPKGRFAVSRGCFLPPPRVESAVLRLERVPGRAPESVLREAGRVADAAFAQRRKTLRNSLLASGLDAGSVDGALQQAGIDGSRRAETLSSDEFIELVVSMHN